MTMLLAVEAPKRTRPSAGLRHAIPSSDSAYNSALLSESLQTETFATLMQQSYHSLKRGVAAGS